MITRRDTFRFFGAAALCSAAPLAASAGLPTRPIPASDEALPVVGFGSTKAVRAIGERGPGPISAVLDEFVRLGGRVVDTAPRPADLDAPFGEVLSRPEFDGELFLATKINATGRDEGLAQFRQSQTLLGRRRFDLVQIKSLTDLDTQWPNLRDIRDRDEARYIGVTVAHERLYEALERFMRKEKPDFVQLNYSVIEHTAEERLLPLAADLGIAVLVNGPFMNGEYFARVRDHELPEWARDAGCRGWADFSLKYVLAHPAVTCVLTETTRPEHIRTNIEAAYGLLLDHSLRKRMRKFAQQL